MPSEILMPQMGADMDEGTVVRWLKKPGDPVKRGEAIAEIETDKATVDLESFEEGIFAKAVVNEGAKVPVDTIVAYLVKPGESLDPVPSGNGASGNRGTAETPAAAPTQASTPAPLQRSEAPPASAPATAAAPSPPSSQAPASGQQPAPQRPAPTGRLRASPLARNLAAELNIDLAKVRGTGPDGRVVKRDIEAAAHRPAEPEQRPEPAPATVQYEMAATVPNGAAPGEVHPFSRMRQAIARRMAESKREAPHYYVTVDVDMTNAMALRRDLNAAGGEGTHVTVNDLLVKAAALAIKKYPAFNASFGAEGLVFHDRINVCIGVALEDGLIAPAIMDCGSKSLGEISRATHDLSERTRNGHLRPSEMSEGTFTISNLGAYGVETLIAIIQPPQSAIIGAGMVESRPVVRDGQIVIREMVKLALSADHRVTDGAQGAEFMREVKAILKNPLRLAL